ncbi:hypothetical protein IHE61_30995 [Streptomyces sp. GKU 257-1]|nr:hypothetical protein [Streptomyces sp. GKU 257-1]
MIALMKDQQQGARRRGMRRGTRYTVPNYDPATGDSYRPGTSFAPETAVKLIRMCEMTDMSVSGFLNALVDKVTVDENGTPVGWPTDVDLREAG